MTYFPGMVKDVNTGKMSGYDVDIMDEVARRMKVKVEWTAETNWPNFATDMNANKFDVLCVGYWANPVQAKFALPTIPLFYQPSYLVTRADDHRFDKDVYKINDPNITLAVLDGDVPDTMADELFPLVKRSRLSQQTAYSQVFQDVATKKADVTIGAYEDIQGYMKTNPGKLKAITDQPLRYFSKTLQMPVDATTLQSALNITFHDMQLDGTMDRIIKKYATSQYDYYLVDWSKKQVIK